MNKDKFNLEYPLKSIPAMLLWNYVATASGLSQWFADEVRQYGKQFTFIWNKSETIAVQLSARSGSSIRFRWEDADNKEYFELKISVSELTDMTILSITDFAFEDEIDESVDLWNVQVDRLKRVLGC
ncbi:MAG: START-like domain-containing protein [Bacteroidales bacterium]